MEKLTVAMLVRGDVAHDNRVRREARAVARLGHRVVVLAVSKSEPPEAEDGVVYEQLPRPLDRRRRQRDRVRARGEAYMASKRSPRVLATGAQLAGSRVWLRVLREGHELNPLRSTLSGKRINFSHVAQPALERLRPDVVHAHDLKTLYAGARYCAHAGVPLVYDAHEFELYSLAVKNRRQRAAAWAFERYGIRRAAAVITVSDEIAEELARLHGIRKPYVVLNTPPAGLRDRAVTPPLRVRAGVGDEERLLVYVGGVHPARGTSQLVDALPGLPPRVHLAIVGPRRREADDDLLERATRLGVEGRLHLVDPVPGDDVPALIAGADVSILPGLDACRSYELSMPNKLFESMQAGLPLAVSDRWRAASDFVREHRLGSVFDVYDVASIARAVEEVVEYVPDGIRDPAALAALQEQYSWEAQARVLGELYAALPVRG